MLVIEVPGKKLSVCINPQALNLMIIQDKSLTIRMAEEFSDRSFPIGYDDIGKSKKEEKSLDEIFDITPKETVN